MPYVPYIPKYKPFYVQPKGGSMKDTRDYGLVAKSNPYPLLPNPKEPYKNDFKDENGHDEYLDVMHYEPIEFEVSFFIKTYDEGGVPSAELLRRQVAEFFSYIQGEFMFYDSYTNIGRSGVRYAGYKEESFKSWNNYSKAIFTITFKVNNPLSLVVEENGVLVDKSESTQE